jgi:hypothetical protein
MRTAYHSSDFFSYLTAFISIVPKLKKGATQITFASNYQRKLSTEKFPRTLALKLIH